MELLRISFCWNVARKLIIYLFGSIFLCGILGKNNPDDPVSPGGDRYKSIHSKPYDSFLLHITTVPVTWKTGCTEYEYMLYIMQRLLKIEGKIHWEKEETAVSSIEGFVLVSLQILLSFNTSLASPP